MENEFYKKYRSMDSELLRRKLESKLYAIMDINEAGESERAYNMLSSMFGHSEKHIEQTDGQMLKRLIDEGKVASTFGSKSEYVDFLTNGLITKAETICKWLQSDNLDREQYKRMDIRLNMREYFGAGWILEDEHYQKKETKILAIVLERDTYRESEFPFFPVTVFADITKEARDIGEPVNPHDIAYSKEVRYDGKIERCLARYRSDLPAGCEAVYMPKEGDYPEGIKITGHGLKMYIRERDEQIEVVCKNNGRGTEQDTYITMREVQQRCPDLAFFAEEMSAAYDIIKTGAILPDRRVTESHSKILQDKIKTVDISYTSGDNVKKEKEVKTTLTKTNDGYKLSGSLDSILSNKIPMQSMQERKPRAQEGR